MNVMLFVGILAVVVLFVFIASQRKGSWRVLEMASELEKKEVAELPDGATAVDASGQPVQLAEDGTPLLNQTPSDEHIKKEAFNKNLEKAKQLAIEEPAIVANVVKEWVNGNG